MADTNSNLLIYNIMRKLVSWELGVYSFLLTFRSKLNFQLFKQFHAKFQKTLLPCKAKAESDYPVSDL